jgi:alpha-galactosidase
VKNAPFFTIEMDDRSIVGALEWSGTWRVQFTRSGNRLSARAGMERTRFLLHPGEKVRMPRVLLLQWKGDRQESNSRFRQLVYRHYAARREGAAPLPILFCNTCFTRGGGWLNECTASNQISLIRAYGKLGREALVTDAGWFTGGWPDGAGNWDVRRDAYPDGMEPVARAGRESETVIGRWMRERKNRVGLFLATKVGANPPGR